jgi:ubiquitin thioesterase protein OTUB1
MSFTTLADTVLTSALAFAYLERLLHSPDPELSAATALSTLESTIPMLEAAGFQKLVFEDFYDVLAGLVRAVIAPDAKGRTLSSKSLLQAFQNAEGAFSSRLSHKTS